MKLLLFSFLFLSSLFSFSQNIKRIIDRNDSKALLKYIEERDVIDDLITIQDKERKTHNIHPLMYASIKEKSDLVKLLAKNKSKIPDFETHLSLAFIISISKQNIELSDFLYGLKPNINEICKPCHGHNAIMTATAYGQENLFHKLKSAAEFNLVSADSNNLFHLISQDLKYFNQNIFDEIKSHQEIDVNLINKYRRTPLHNAARSGNEKLFFELLSLGAKPNNLNEFYADAILGGNIKIYNYTKKLFNKKDPNWATTPEISYEDGETYYPLEHAIKNNSFSIMKVIYDDMLNEIVTVGMDDQIEILTEILNSRQLENEQFWPLWEAIHLENKEMYTFLVKSMAGFNNLNIEYTAYNDFIEDDYTENAEVIFTKFEYRSAKRRFGKEYIKNLFEELKIKF